MVFSINDKVMVVLKEQFYFDPWDGRREASLLSKKVMQEELLGLRHPNLTDNYKLRVYKEKGIMGLKSFVGRYVGDRPGLIKVEPLYGLQHQSSEYFIVREDQIEKIEKINDRDAKES